MSIDAVTSPTKLVYQPSEPLNDRMRYRLIDSPITRLLIGWGLFLQDEDPNPVDWNWSNDWDENAASGALPPPSTLTAARLSVSWLFPLSCMFVFLLAKRIDGIPTAIITITLFATNALVLMHTRRSMAESALICTFCALVWLMVDYKKSGWITGLAAGLAINSKQTAVATVFIANLTAFLLPLTKDLRKQLLRAGMFLFIVLGISALLNPVFWQYPVEAIREGIAQRADLTSRMRKDYKISGDPLEQSLLLVAHTFIQPPAVADVENYKSETQLSEKAYFQQPMNNLFRGFIGGSILLILTITGWIILLKKSITQIYAERLRLLIFSAIVLSCILSLMLFTAAPFQRYYIILVPLFSVFQASALASAGRALINVITKKAALTDSPRKL